MKDRLDARLGTGNVALVADADRETAPEQAAKEGGRVRQLVHFVIPFVQRDEDAQVVFPRRHLDARAGELG